MRLRFHRWLEASVCVGLLASGVWLAAFPQTRDLKGQVVDSHDAPIPNAVCSLSGRGLPEEGVQRKTDVRGNFDFPALMPGTYSVTCAAVGHEPNSKSDIVVGAGKALAALRIVLPKEIFRRQQVTVRGHLREAETRQAAPPSSFSSHELMTLPLAELKFKAALPLVPGVVRTPDGKLNIKGTPEESGMLMVDGADLVDPVTGAFSVEVPIDTIEELQVYKAPYLARYGRFSGGLTTIRTKPPLDYWHWELNDMIPDPFIEQGHIQGIQGDAPRLYLTGPIIKNKLNFSESFIYDLNRAFIEGQPWPHNISRREGVSSFSNFQYIFSPQHLLSFNVRVFPARRKFDNLSALVPESASSNWGQRGEQIGGIDHYLFKSGAILTSLVAVTKFDTYAYGQGPESMLVTPNGFGGNYFNAYRRFANQQELSETYQFTQKHWLGTHNIQVGGDYFHRSYHGISSSQPVLITNTADNTLESIDFSGPAQLSDEDTEFEAYGQDRWLPNPHLSFSYGMRFSNENIGSPDAFAPRGGFVYSPGTSGRTVIHGGIGIFYDRIPMLAADYTENPTRTITFYSPSGVPLGPPQFWDNQYSIVGEHGRKIVPIKNHLGSTPYDRTWSLELDQELTPSWLLRVSYLRNRAYNEYVVNPASLAGGQNAFFMTNTGSSRYNEFETTMRFRAGERANLNVSYVHSLTRGDLNTIDALYVPFEQPVINPDFFANLPSDIPNRVITWGEFNVPWGLTLSPVFDIHNGFPYSSFNVLQNYAGQPDGFRFPTFYSLDLEVSKVFHIPFLHFGFFKTHKFRGAFQVYDITDHLNPVDVYNNTASPYYNHFVAFQHMTFNTYFDVLF